MCTLSWRREPGVLEVWFNRDEQRTRPIANPPQVQKGPVPFLAPQDPQGGGTWIFVNQNGRIGALLNFYEATAPAPAKGMLRSRGLLVRDLAETSASEDTESFLQRSVQQHVYAPFYLWTADVETTESLWAWDGTQLQARPLPFPMHTTSSFRTEEVCTFRKECFLKSVSDPLHPESRELAAFHKNGKNNGDAWSVHMSREDASTVSTSRIVVQNGQATLTYSTPDEAEIHLVQLLLQ